MIPGGNVAAYCRFSSCQLFAHYSWLLSSWVKELFLAVKLWLVGEGIFVRYKNGSSRSSCGTRRILSRFTNGSRFTSMDGAECQ
ncbi:hypothetical protein BDA96_01G438500 [Sorghum bicolor]|uniref:Uncharacterized protein n=2 Tax=Sorghum bicolor TaxID=4558 RepID=A0A921S4Y6_SORBI|nr:hypothetical protein BDA96_01G438500 [Sorghum bicolor]OQU92787.1 hypothetical protein SORBI_3001G412350 [Sorghum bicolor]